ncbi:hypothetical protein Gotur_020567 [Gossypium turneri]
MALKLVSMSFQSQEVPCFGLPAMASFGSPRFFMTSTVPSANMLVLIVFLDGLRKDEEQLRPATSTPNPKQQ